MEKYEIMERLDEISKTINHIDIAEHPNIVESLYKIKQLLSDVWLGDDE